MDLLILGASARAAAFSAIRIGLRPTCIDLFADADLASTCPALWVEPGHYPDGLARLAADLPPMPCLYTGAIENHPDLVDRISARHRLLGIQGDSLRAVRDPIALADAVRVAGLAAPEVRIEPTGLPVDGSWLRKPIASAGGRGISPWLGQSADTRQSASIISSASKGCLPPRSSSANGRQPDVWGSLDSSSAMGRIDSPIEGAWPPGRSTG